MNNKTVRFMMKIALFVFCSIPTFGQSNVKVVTMDLKVSEQPAAFSGLKYYDSEPVYLDKKTITDALGIPASQLTEALSSGTVVFQAIDPLGNISSTSTAIAPGHWFSSAGYVTKNSSSLYVFSELNSTSCILNVGNYPERLSDGDKFSFTQALTTTTADADGYLHRVVFNVTVTVSSTATLVTVPCNDGYFDIQNCRVSEFLHDVQYEYSDTSRVERYNVPSTSRLDQQASVPSSWTLTDAASQQNLIPGQTYNYSYGSTSSSFVAIGNVRMINVPSLGNIRDLGGWTTASGKRLAYGLLYRGCEWNGSYINIDDDDKSVLYDLGIRAELDLRTASEAKNISASPITGITYKRIVNEKYYLEGVRDCPSCWKADFDYILQQLSQSKPVYFHCIWGCDRAGTLAFMLEGLLGMSYSDLCKEYELSTFSYLGTIRKKKKLDDLYQYILTFDGETLQDKFYTYWTTEAGVSADDIATFRNMMLVDDDITDVSHLNSYYHFIHCVEGKSATCTEVGTSSYYICDDCGRTYSDAEGQTSLNLDKISTPALGHDFSTKSLCSTPDANGLYGYVCSRGCGQVQAYNIVKGAIAGTTNLNLNVSDDGTYSVDVLNLNDKEAFSSPVTFTAASVHLERTASSSWGTICLPYSVDVPDDYNVQELQTDGLHLDAADPYLKFTKVDRIEAGKAYIWRYSGLGSPTSDALDATNVDVSSATASDATLVGVLGSKVVFNQSFRSANEGYSFLGLSSADNSIHPLSLTASCAPFRAYFKVLTSEVPSVTNGAKVRVFFDDTQLFTSLDELVTELDTTDSQAYNLRGQRIDASQYHGVCIINGRKVIK